MAAMARADAQALLTLKVLLGEAEVLLLLTQTEVADAQQLIVALLKLHDSFPGLLAPMAPALLMLAGEFEAQWIAQKGFAYTAHVKASCLCK